MARHTRQCHSDSGLGEAAGTAAAAESSNNTAGRAAKRWCAAVGPGKKPIRQAALRADPADSRSTGSADDRAAPLQRRENRDCCSLLRGSCRRVSVFLVVLALTALTWPGVLNASASSVLGIVTATATSASRGRGSESVATAWGSSSDEEPTLGDVLPAVPYHALLSPWTWLLCLGSFFLLHVFCKQLLLLLRLVKHGRRRSRLALLLQSKVFPVHGINRLVATTHALVALNWGVLVLLERYSARSAGAGVHHSAAVVSPGKAATTAANRAVAAALGARGGDQGSSVAEAAAADSSCKPPVEKTRAATDSSKAAGAGGAAAAPVCLWGFGEPVTSQERALLLFSLSYFIYDTCYEGLHGDIYGCLHHGAAILGLLNVLGSDIGARDLIAALVVGEVSTPLLHLRYCCIQFAKRLAAAAAALSSDAAAPKHAPAAVTALGHSSAARTPQQKQQTQQREPQQEEVQRGEERHPSGAATGWSAVKEFTQYATGGSVWPLSADKEMHKNFNNADVLPAHPRVLPADPVEGALSTAAPGAGAAAAAPGVRPAVCDRSTAAASLIPGAASARWRTAGGRPEATAATGVETRASGHDARGFAPEEAAAAPSGAAGESKGGRGRTATAAGLERETPSPATDVSAAAATTADCTSAAAAPSSCCSLPRAADAAALRSSEPRGGSRTRCETRVGSGSNVHTRTFDSFATTGAAAILAAALGTAVAAAALRAATPPGMATAAATAAASCSFIVFSIALRLFQRRGGHNSIFATYFRIPAGYVHRFSPPSKRQSAARGSADGEPESGAAGAAAPATALTQEQEAAAAAAFLKRSGERIHSWLDGVEKSFFLVFTIGRAVLAPCVVYACVTCSSTPVLVRASGVLILIVSCYWLFLLSRHVQKRLQRRREERGKASSSSSISSVASERKERSSRCEGEGKTKENETWSDEDAEKALGQ